MSSELPAWHSIQQLLLAFTFDMAIAHLNPIICSLMHSLSSKKVSSLFRQPSEYLFCLADKTSMLQPNPHEMINVLAKQQFEAVIIFTEPDQSPYSLAYFSYLAGIPIRIGQSCEFGGGLLSLPIQPPLDPVAFNQYQQHLLHSIGLLPSNSSPNLIL
jgi:hypothetical protein